MQTHTTSTLKGMVTEKGASIPVRQVKNHTFAGITAGYADQSAKIRGKLYAGDVVPAQTFARPFMGAQKPDGSWLNSEQDVRDMLDAITPKDLEGPPSIEDFLSDADQAKRAIALVALADLRDVAVKAGFKTEKSEKRSVNIKTWLAEKAKGVEATGKVVKDRKTA